MTKEMSISHPNIGWVREKPRTMLGSRCTLYSGYLPRLLTKMNRKTRDSGSTQSRA